MEEEQVRAMPCGISIAVSYDELPNGPRTPPPVENGHFLGYQIKNCELANILNPHAELVPYPCSSGVG